MNMNVWVVIIHDKHSEPGVEIFTTPEAAIAYARKTAAEFATDPEDIEENTTYQGILLDIRYSPESSLWVVETTVRDS